MKPVLLITLLWVGVAQAAFQQHSTQADTGTAQELQRIAQVLLDAVGEGNKAVWDRYLADDCLYTTEGGRR
ncbi:MAG: hypothetical protein ACREQ8_15315 [Woeseiaceae bacterium]